MEMDVLCDSVCECVCVWGGGGEGGCDVMFLTSLSHGGGSSEVGQELEAETDHEIPDVPGHLRTSDEDAPDHHHQEGVEGVADVPEPEHKDTQKTQSTV